MVKMIKPYLLITCMFAILLGACGSGPEVRPNEGVPVEEPPEEEIPPPSNILVGEYEFSMTANFKDKSEKIPDTMDSKWDGKFTIDSDGQIEGKGTYKYQSKIFLMNTAMDRCGYDWDHSGEGEFSIGGTVLMDGSTIPLEISSWSVKEPGETSEPNLICPGNTDALLPLVRDNWVPSRRNVVLEIISNQYWVLNKRLKPNEHYIIQGSSIYFDVLISAPIPLAPLGTP